MKMSAAKIAVRAAKTFLQALTAGLGLTGTGLVDIAANASIKVAIGAALLSALTNTFTDIEADLS